MIGSIVLALAFSPMVMAIDLYVKFKDFDLIEMNISNMF